jgi:hypothetical protein
LYKFIFICFLILTQPILAIDLPAGLGPPIFQKKIMSYSGSYQPKSTFQKSSTESQAEVIKQSLNLKIPVFRGEKNGLNFSSYYESLDLSPDLQQSSDYYNIKFGMSYNTMLENNETLTFGFNYGSASDKPFQDSTVNTIDATATYSFQAENENDRWFWLLNYSNNRSFLNNLPLPGFAYMYSPSKEFRAVFGIPFATFNWKFEDPWTWNFFVLATNQIKSTLSYSLGGPVQIFSGIDFSQQTFMQYGRTNQKERVYFAEKEIFLGFKSPLNDTFLMEIESGYSFDRTIFSAETYSLNPSNATSIGSSWYGKLGLTAMF